MDKTHNPYIAMTIERQLKFMLNVRTTLNVMKYYGMNGIIIRDG